jgi:hypothetical protein
MTWNPPEPQDAGPSAYQSQQQAAPETVDVGQGSSASSAATAAHTNPRTRRVTNWTPPPVEGAGPLAHQTRDMPIEIIEGPGLGPTGRPSTKALPAGWVVVPDAQAEQRAAVAAAEAKGKAQQA